MKSVPARKLEHRQTPAWIVLGASLCLAVSSVNAADLDFAHGLYRQKRFALAAEEYASYLAKFPDGPESVEARFFLAECHVQLKKDSDALPLFQSVVAAVESNPDLLPEPQRAIAGFRVGEILFHRHDFPGAVPPLKRVLERYAQSDVYPHAAYLLAEAQIETNDVDGASASLKAARAGKVDPDLTDRLTLVEGKIAERQGRVEVARNAFAAVAAAKDPILAADAQLALGVLEHRQKRPDLAVAAFQSLLDRFPKSPLVSAARLNLGAALEQLGRYTEAMAAYQAILDSSDLPEEARPLVPEAHFRLGLAKFQSKDFAGAKATFAEAKQRYPNGPLVASVTFHEAASMVKLGDFTNARPILARFIDKYPSDPLAPQALYFLARCGIEQKDLPYAETTLDQLQRKFPDSTWTDAARISLAEAFLNASSAVDAKTVERIRGFLDASQDADTKRRLRYYAALAAFQMGDMKSVVTFLEPILAWNADDAIRHDTNYLLGLAHVRLSQWNEAIAPLEAFFEKDPLSPQARAALIQIAVAISSLPATPDRDARLVKALELSTKRSDASAVLLDAANAIYAKRLFGPASIAYAKSMEKDMDKSPAALLGLAWAEFELGKKELSLEHFRKAAELSDPKSDPFIEAVYMQGVIASDLGRSDEAIALLTNVHTNGGESKFATDAGPRLARLLAANGKADEADRVYAALANRAKDASSKYQAVFDRAWLAIDRQESDVAAKLFAEVVGHAGPGRIAAESAVKLAEIAHAKGEFPTAVEWTQKADQLAPPESLLPAILYRRGLSLHQLGEADAARSNLATLLERYPKDPLVVATLFWLGEVEFDARRFDPAIERYRELLDHPGNEKYAGLARLRISQSHFQSGRLEEAAKEAETLLTSTKDPATRDEAMYVQGRVLQQQAKFDEAREVYRGILRDEKTESAAKAQFMIGETYFLQERHDEAMKELLKVQILYRVPTWQAAALLEIGKLQEKRRDMVEARRAYETVLKDFAKEPAAQEARRRLDALPSGPSTGP